MAGYNWREGKSNNAVIAVSEGKMPAFHMAAWLRKRGRRYSGCSTTIVRKCLTACEWHHTSKFFNSTEYYDPRDLIDSDIRDRIAEMCNNQRVNRRLIRRHKLAGFTWVQASDCQNWYRLERVCIEESFETSRLIASLEIISKCN